MVPHQKEIILIDEYSGSIPPNSSSNVNYGTLSVLTSDICLRSVVPSSWVTFMVTWVGSYTMPLATIADKKHEKKFIGFGPRIFLNIHYFWAFLS